MERWITGQGLDNLIIQQSTNPFYNPNVNLTAVFKASKSE
jgi:hypothetical protein